MQMGEIVKVLKFETPDCTWCKVAGPHIEAYVAAKRYALEVVDAEADAATAEKYGIMSVPAMVLVDVYGVAIYKCWGYPAIMEKINE